MLKIEINTPEMCKRIEAAFAALYSRDGIAEFEHGQWWIITEKQTFAVCDAEGSPDHVCDGFSFEEI